MTPDRQNSTAASRALYDRALKVMPGGNSRALVYMAPHPLYAARGEGARVIDADGVPRIDFANNFYSLIHGHAHPAIVAAAGRRLAQGTCFGMPTEEEVLLAENLAGRHPSFAQLRFCNTGTEAVMMAIKAARAIAGRPAIVKCEGAYHGMYDHAEIALDSTPQNWGPRDAIARVDYVKGAPSAVAADTLVVPFNDPEALARALAANAHRIAAVLVDLMPSRLGMIEASPAFRAALRAETKKIGALLIVDEVVNFRLGEAGLVGAMDVDADLVTLGKIIGGGFPVGAFAGKPEHMAVFDPRPGKPPVTHSGTFTANPMTMAAGLASMELLTPEAYAHLDRLGARARAGIDAAFRRAGVPGRAEGRGSLFYIQPHDRPAVDYRSGYKTPAEQAIVQHLHRTLLDAGVFLPTGLSGALSTPMTEADIDAMIEGVAEGLRTLPRAAAAE